MSAQPASLDASHPHPHSTPASTSATASHPSSARPDPTLSATNNAPRGYATAAPAGPAELAHLKVELRNGLRQFPDFPEPGVLFEDIMPLFASPKLHTALIRALELQVAAVFNTSVGEKSDIEVVVGLESRGFLFGPTLAKALGAGFVPVRKKGKLPGPCATETYQKEYGADVFQMQEDAIKPGAKVVVVDDIIATGELVRVGGVL